MQQSFPVKFPFDGMQTHRGIIRSSVSGERYKHSPRVGVDKKTEQQIVTSCTVLIAALPPPSKASAAVI